MAKFVEIDGNKIRGFIAAKNKPMTFFSRKIGCSDCYLGRATKKGYMDSDKFNALCTLFKVDGKMFLKEEPVKTEDNTEFEKDIEIPTESLKHSEEYFVGVAIYKVLKRIEGILKKEEGQ